MDIVTQICSLMGVIVLVQGLIPTSLRQPFYTLLLKIWEWLFQTSQFVYAYVPENPSRLSCNSLYRQVEIYLGSLHTSLTNKKLNIHRHDTDVALVYTLANGETMKDKFEGISMTWTHTCTKNKSVDGRNSNYGKSSSSSSSLEEKRGFSLKMRKHKDRQALLDRYLDYISNKANDIDRLKSRRFLYTNSDHKPWKKVPFHHPSTFRTLALPPPLKERIIVDLQNFSNGKELHHHAGRAWKRGYLLYGPPGTGKSSLIAAIANFLHYDIYYLELTKVRNNSSLRSLLTSTTRKSLIVIEDIDCTLELSNRSNVGKLQHKREGDDSDEEGEEIMRRGDERRSSGVTLSGMLNFTDGLWSCCGEERIFVFTSNHKDRLDPALLRSGRMDFHILLSYCAFPAFKVLASNYLHISDHHPLLGEVENAMKFEPHVTPAEIAEIMISHQDNPDKAIEAVLDALHRATTLEHDANTHQQANNGPNQVSMEDNGHGNPKNLKKRSWNIVNLRRSTMLKET